MKRITLSLILAALVAVVTLTAQTVDITISLTSAQQAALEADRVARLVNGQPQFRDVQAQAVFVCQDAIASIEKRYASSRVEAIMTALMDADAAKLAAVEAELKR